jgi:hypothetical protein
MSAIDLMTQQYVEIQKLKTELDAVRAERDEATQTIAQQQLLLGSPKTYAASDVAWRNRAERAEAQVQAVRAFCQSARFSIVQVRDVLARLDALSKETS